MKETCYDCAAPIEIIPTQDGNRIGRHVVAWSQGDTPICRASGRRANRRLVLTPAGWTVLLSYGSPVAARDSSGRCYAITSPPSGTSLQHVLTFIKDSPIQRVNSDFLAALLDSPVTVP